MAQTHQTKWKCCSPSFTLIELLVVISIITLIASVIFASINKSRIAARDTRRIGDLQEFRKAIFLASDANLSLGSASTVYTSLSDSSATCASYTLSSLPAGWHYHCSATPTKNNGTGWLPIPFSQTSPPFLSALSTDPLNTGTPSAAYYYTYVYDPSTQNWNLNAQMENPAQGVGTIAIKDGGISAVKYELGTDPTYGPTANNGLPSNLNQGLVGYWPMDDGMGSVVYDVSGNGNNGTWYGTGSHWNSSGKIQGAALFNGSNDSIRIPWTGSNLPSSGVFNNHDFSFSLWYSPADPGGYGWCVLNVYKANPNPLNIGLNFFLIVPENSTNFRVYHLGSHYNEWNSGGNVPAYQPSWNSFTYVYTNSTRLEQVYHNGALLKSHTISVPYAIDSAPLSGGVLGIGGPTPYCYYGRFFNGSIDDVRMYNRALSAAEVQQLYDAEK